jgi:hypothetical protein
MKTVAAAQRKEVLGCNDIGEGVAGVSPGGAAE